MCRLLAVKSSVPFDSAPHLKAFAQVAKTSKEYQGHGWGMAIREGDQWRHYKNLLPIWDDILDSFGSTTELLVHARSAFQDEGIVIENNMPFYDERYIFIFNGELRGVKIKEDGRIGAEKIFNYLKRFDHGNFLEALQRGVPVLQRRSRYVRAMNIIVSDHTNLYCASFFNEDPDYFGMSFKQTAQQLVICSQPYSGETGWIPIPNQTIRIFE
ncbi:MAG: hypothetical protein AABZ60_23520 [Planctomycetota bacterium]